MLEGIRGSENKTSRSTPSSLKLSVQDKSATPPKTKTQPRKEAAAKLHIFTTLSSTGRSFHYLSTQISSLSIELVFLKSPISPQKQKALWEDKRMLPGFLRALFRGGIFLHVFAFTKYWLHLLIRHNESRPPTAMRRKGSPQREKASHSWGNWDSSVLFPEKSRVKNSETKAEIVSRF